MLALSAGEAKPFAFLERILFFTYPKFYSVLLNYCLIGVGVMLIELLNETGIESG